MDIIDIKTDVLTEAASRFKQARGNLIEAAGMLKDIKNEKLYRGRFNSFQEYIESECQISLSMASKLIKVYEHYVLTGGLEHGNLKGVDHEKLYLLVEAEGSPQEKVAKAQTLSRSEIKDSLIEAQHPDCAHTEVHTLHVCKACNKRV